MKEEKQPKKKKKISEMVQEKLEESGSEIIVGAGSIDIGELQEFEYEMGKHNDPFEFYH